MQTCKNLLKELYKNRFTVHCNLPKKLMKEFNEMCNTSLDSQWKYVAIMKGFCIGIKTYLFRVFMN